MQKTIELTITKDQEGTYFPLVFDIECDIDKLELEYSYQRFLVEEQANTSSLREQAIVDFSMVGPGDQFLGSSGSDRSYLFFSKTESSKGFAKVKTMIGQWQVIVGAYKVPEKGIKVEYVIRGKECQRHLIRGDNHVHSLASDGQHSVASLRQIAIEMGLDYLMLTDHNNYHPEAHELTDHSLTLIPGVEWTQYQGHGNFLGLDQSLGSTFVTTDLEALEERIALVHDMGGLFVINHPFCPHVPWKWPLDVNFDAVEVYNGGTHPFANHQAIEWWHQELCKGRRIPIVGGSDFHRFSAFASLATPTSNLYVNDHSPESILQAIQSGHGYITHQVNAPGLDIHSDDGHYLGDLVDKEAIITFSFTKLGKGQVIKIISDQNEEFISISENLQSLTHTRKRDGSLFYRVEIWDKNYIDLLADPRGLLILVSNPIYFNV